MPSLLRSLLCAVLVSAVPRIALADGGPWRLPCRCATPGGRVAPHVSVGVVMAGIGLAALTVTRRQGRSKRRR